MKQTLYFTSDHAGVPLKQELFECYHNQGYSCIDLGPYTLDSVDYADYGHRLAQTLLEDPHALGIALCGSGNGMAMSLNRHTHIRAGLAWTPEIAQLVKAHNNANVLVLPARFMTLETAQQSIELYLNTSFEGGRHQLRIDKLNVF